MMSMIAPEGNIVYLDRDPFAIAANPLGIPNAPDPTKFFTRLKISFDIEQVPPISRTLALWGAIRSFILRTDFEIDFLMLLRKPVDRKE
jgi:hypothetical protein